MNPVLKTTLFVVKNSKKVKINKKKIFFLVKKLAGKIKIPQWPEDLHLSSNNPEEILAYLIILDSLNFCFWPKKWKVKYKSKFYYEYFALSMSLRKLFESYQGVINFNILKDISFQEFKKFLDDAPLLEQRYRIFKKVSEFMIQKYPDPTKFILSANQSTKVLLKKIYKELPYFDDFAFYKNKKIYFLKRAQILIADIYGAFEGKELGYFKDIDYLTCFADYKLPQILNYYGILEYSWDLENKIKNKNLIKPGSQEEIEIRANTILAVEFLKKDFKNLGLNLKSFEIDWYLWNQAQKIKFNLPHHRSKSVYY